MLYYTGFRVFEIKTTKSGLFLAELGNGKCINDQSLEKVKAVLDAYEKLTRYENG